ncbi:MAG: response regulator [Acidobacteriota bacterium]
MRILFVEDSDLFMFFRETFFARIGWQVLNARDGKSGIDRCREDKPDLVVLSDLLPDMEGVEACRQFRSLRREKAIPVITILDGVSGSKIRQYRQIGCNDYMLRPVDPGALMERISHLLRVAYRKGPRLMVLMEAIHSRREQPALGNILNLSETGLFVETNDALEPGTLLELELRLPGTSDLLSIRGLVARRHRLAGKVQYGLGVKFQEMNAHNRELIQTYIKNETLELHPATT